MHRIIAKLLSIGLVIAEKQSIISLKNNVLRQLSNSNLAAK